MNTRQTHPALEQSARAEAWRGFLDILPLLGGAAPFAILIGSLAVDRGLTPTEAVLMSATVYAGGAQFIALEQWAEPLTLATGGLSIIAATALVNLRHVLMGAALAPHVARLPRRKRLFFVAIHTDETWAIALRRSAGPGLTTPYVMGMIIPFYLQWWLFTGLGAVSGAWIGDPAQYGFDFVFPAAFLTLILGFWRAIPDALGRQSIVIAVSLGVALAVHSLVEGPWYIFSAGLAGAATGAALWKPESGPEPA
ncbi:MAG: AzlC family ABC transporter permease [Alphaproteobacteria bacterium]|nr:AzlC family ABC transporter permease [Alphaproteobacteria bacterium]